MKEQTETKNKFYKYKITLDVLSFRFSAIRFSVQFSPVFMIIIICFILLGLLTRLVSRKKARYAVKTGKIKKKKKELVNRHVQRSFNTMQIN